MAMKPPGDDLPPGYTARAATMDDVGAVYRLAAACSLADHGEIDFTLEDIRSYWAYTVADMARDGWAILSDAGELVAEADVARKGPDRYWCYANVHPDHLGRGLGTYLLNRAERRMREWADEAPCGTRVTAHQEASTSDRRARELLERHSYTPVRRSWRMQIELEEAPAQPSWPEGITVRRFTPGQDEHAVYEAKEEAFAEHWGHAPRTFEEYAHWRFQGERYDPAFYFLATVGEAITGCALCRRQPGGGRVGELGVRRAYRHRGIGLALLRHAFGEFYRIGVRTINLMVDAQNATGAVQLYEQAGMRAVREWVEYAKERREGDVREDGHDARNQARGQ